MKQMFRSLAIRNFRLWSGGLFISATGSWMQMTAQDWLVLTELTKHNAAMLGVVVALQFIPQLVLTPLAGGITDRFDRRNILLASQVVQLVLALTLGVLVIAGVAQLWHVFVLAFLLGCASAFDGPARTTFIVELVSDDNLANGVALSSAAFNSARLVGPAVAGVAIAAFGTGWVFVINSATFIAVIAALLAMRRADMNPQQPRQRQDTRLVDGFRYLRHHGELVVTMVVVFLIGSFGLNAAVFTATMARVEFGTGAEGFGLLASCLGFGAVLGSLASAAIARTSHRTVLFSAIGFTLSCLGASLAPNYWTFAAVLPVLGICLLMVMTTANSYIQLTTEPAFRGRVVGIYMACFIAGGPIGGPLYGEIANLAGPRWAIGAAGVAGLLAVVVLAGWLHRAGRTDAAARSTGLGATELDLETTSLH